MQQRPHNQKVQLPIAADYDEAAGELIKFIFHKAHVEQKTSDRSRSKPTIEIEDNVPGAKKAFKEGVEEYSSLSMFWPPNWVRLLLSSRREEGNNYVQGLDLDVNGGAFQFLNTLYTALTGVEILDNNKVDETEGKEKPVKTLEDIKLIGGWDPGSLVTNPSMNCQIMWKLLALLPAYKKTDPNPSVSVGVDGLQMIAKCFVLRVDAKVKEEQRKAKLKKDQEAKRAQAEASVVLSASVLASNSKLDAPEPDIRASTIMATKAMEDVMKRLSGMCASGKGLSKQVVRRVAPPPVVQPVVEVAPVVTPIAEGAAPEQFVIPDAPPPPPPPAAITRAVMPVSMFKAQLDARRKAESDDEKLEANVATTAQADGARYSPSMGKMKSD